LENLEKKVKKYSDEWFLDQYFKYESVEEAFKSSKEHLPISVAQFHRIVAAAGVVKSPGRHVSLPEILHFFKQKALSPGTPIEKLYKKMPYDFKSSLATIHRIYKSIQNKTFRREAAALALLDSNNNILVGRETADNSKYGKRQGDWSIPMGFSKSDEQNYLSALRIAQHEVSNKLNFIPKNIMPFMYFDLLDTRISVFKINLPENFDIQNCSSYRLSEHKFISKYELLNLKNTREGVKEIISKLQSSEVELVTSELNKAIYKNGVQSEIGIALFEMKARANM